MVSKTEEFVLIQSFARILDKIQQFCVSCYDFTHLQAHSELCRMKDAIFHRMNIYVASCRWDDGQVDISKHTEICN